MNFRYLPIYFRSPEDYIEKWEMLMYKELKSMLLSGKEDDKGENFEFDFENV